jgi:hypothetical protein
VPVGGRLEPAVPRQEDRAPDRGGKNNNPATATGMIIGMQNLSGNAEFTEIQIGRDGGEVSATSC